MEAFSTNWFIMYYLLLGVLTFSSGCYLMIKYPAAKSYLLNQADRENPPVLLRTILKYFFLFTLPSLVLSFIPFSWIELLFSLWSLVIVYLAGIRLVRWQETRALINDRPEKLDFFIRMTGAMMVAVSLFIFSLSYLKII